MSAKTPVTVEAADFAREFARYADLAAKNPVVVTNDGLERTVLLSIDEYRRLTGDARTAYRSEDTPQIFINEIDKLIASLPKA